jgi:hypothetical protein
VACSRKNRAEVRCAHHSVFTKVFLALKKETRVHSQVPVRSEGGATGTFRFALHLLTNRSIGVELRGSEKKSGD